MGSAGRNPQEGQDPEASLLAWLRKQVQQMDDDKKNSLGFRAYRDKPPTTPLTRPGKSTARNPKP